MTDTRTSTAQLGQNGEDAAVGFLANLGYRIVERNWRPRAASGSACKSSAEKSGLSEKKGRRGAARDNTMRGEIDCIAWEGRILCFVEVKTRSSSTRGAPQEAVTRAKQRQLSRLANAYVSTCELSDTPCRFDVVEVVWPGGEAAPQITLSGNAFDYIETGNGLSRHGA